MNIRCVVAVDTETTGLDPFAGRIVEVAAVTVSPVPGGQWVAAETFSTLLDPQSPVRASEIHGITDDHVAGAPTFAEVWPALFARLDGALVVGHNVLFDWAFISAEVLRVGLTLPAVTLVDTKAMASAVLDLPSHRLIHCCAHLGIELGDAHSAAADTLATAELWHRLVALAPGTFAAVSPTGPLRFPDAGVVLRGRESAPPPDRERLAG